MTKRPSAAQTARLRASLPQSCVRCGSREQLTLDHQVPLSLGGTNARDNLQILCAPCNQRKNRRECAAYERLSGNSRTSACRGRRRYLTPEAAKDANTSKGTPHYPVACRQCRAYHLSD